MHPKTDKWVTNVARHNFINELSEEIGGSKIFKLPQNVVAYIAQRVLYKLSFNSDRDEILDFPLLSNIGPLEFVKKCCEKNDYYAEKEFKEMLEEAIIQSKSS